MDPSDPNEIPDDGEGGGGEEEKRALRILTRCGCGIILSLGLSFFFSIVFVLVAIGIGNLTAKPPVSVPAICRIVSSSVDIRSSKVCELGLLNYRAKNVLYPLGKGKKRYRCHDDYYWASVFEVEYKEYFSGQVLQAVAEAPKEALPHDCRPSFGTAWSTKMKFKVNETYNCRYTLGSRKADICPDNLFNCQSKDPSVTELVRRFFILSILCVQMDSHFSSFFADSFCAEYSYANQGIARCPFLRNINEPTSFSFSSFSFAVPIPGAKGPIFEDGPGFEMAFRLFHGQDGVVPLSGRPFMQKESPVEPEQLYRFNPLVEKAASISLSSFGGGFFGFDFFSNNFKKSKKNKKSSKQDPSSQKEGNSSHEAISNEWLQTGQCPIAKSYRAVSGVLPLIAKALQPPPGMKLRCPPAVVAARAALARTAFVKGLRPQPLPAKMLAIALLGMAANVPLGVWREHTEKFSPQWFAAVHAAVPFIAMLRKSVLMPKTAMVFTIAASILGQTIGSRAERMRMKARAEEQNSAALPLEGNCSGVSVEVLPAAKTDVCF